MEIKGVILAAGKGARIYPISERYPKPMLPIINRPLMHYQLESMASIGIKEVIVVIGNMGYEIVNRMGTGSDYAVKIRYVEQKETLGIARALGTLEGLLQTPFMMFLGDIFFRSDRLGAMVDAMEDEDVKCVLATKIEEDPEMIKRNFSVIFDEDGFVRRVIEKPRHSTNKHKGCGIYLFNPQIFDAIRRTPRTAMRDEYEITDSIQILINDGARVKGLDVIEQDTNLTTPNDLLGLNLAELARLRKVNLVAEDAVVDPGAVLKNCVVGSKARISTPLALTNCVVFDNAVVDSESDLTDSLVTEDGTINLLK